MLLESHWPRFAPALTPLGALYGFFMRLRRRAYARGLLPAYRPRARVISVGNLSLGGEGKTPVVLYLARFLSERGLKVAILTRGYRGRAKGVVVASRGEGPLEPPEVIGDEAYLLALRSRAPVMVAKDRVLGAFWAIKEFEAEVLILDDGFQHLRLERDLDLVLFSATKKSLNEKVFPAGRLREPKEALSWASAFVITKEDLDQAAAEELSRGLKPFGKPIFRLRFSFSRPYPLDEAPASPPEGYFAFCGVGDPLSFKLAAERVGRLLGFLPLPDHVRYHPGLLKKIKKAGQRCGARGYLTTEKDAVKLISLAERPRPCYVLPMEVVPEKTFEEFVLNAI